MGNSPSAISKVNFEDIQTALKNPEIYIFINTMDVDFQSCLIPNTVSAHQEETIINKHLSNGNYLIKIIVYGKNCNDDNLHTKSAQLLSLGFKNVYMYKGGMFEWLMLSDIYGSDIFPTTSKEIDFLKYKPRQCLNLVLLEY